MQFRLRKKCPYCACTFDMGIGDVVNTMTRKEWGVHCPTCSTRADFRFGFGASLAVSILIAVVSKWVLKLPGELALAASFVAFVLAGSALVLLSPLVERPFDRARRDLGTGNDGRGDGDQRGAG